MDQESVEQMPADRAAKMLERVGWAHHYVVLAKFQEAGVFITAEWAVLIIGQSHLHCVSVLCELLELIEGVLDTHVSHHLGDECLINPRPRCTVTWSNKPGCLPSDSGPWARR